MVGNHSAQSSSLYLPSLDGMRFVAFALVFIHHLPVLRGSDVLEHLRDYGWVGVEMFFVISSYLFFHLLGAEERKTGEIAIGRFYVRRALRIYPLMVAFPVLMLLIYGWQHPSGPARLAGLMLFMDNFMAWIGGYNRGTFASPHLWTLSFEFQIYAIIPVAYIAYRRLGAAKFTKLLLAVALFCMAVRMAFVDLGAKRPIVWVTPFLRPESVLIGIALSINRPTWHWTWSAMAAVIAAILFLSIPVPWRTDTAALVQYPLGAIMCAAFVDAVLRGPGLRSVLGSRPLRALGTISFGLYVFHLWAIHLARQGLGLFGVSPRSVGPELNYLALALLALALTLVLATISYWVLERPFLRLKSRVSAVEGRPLAAKPPSPLTA